MSSPQDQYTEALRAGQEAVIGAVEAWTKSVQSTFGQAAGGSAASVDPKQVIDQVFDFAEKMLEAQRQFAKNLTGAAASAGEAMRRQTESFGETARQQAVSASETARQQTTGGKGV